MIKMSSSQSIVTLGCITMCARSGSETNLTRNSVNPLCVSVIDLALTSAIQFKALKSWLLSNKERCMVLALSLFFQFYAICCIQGSCREDEKTQKKKNRDQISLMTIQISLCCHSCTMAQKYSVYTLRLNRFSPVAVTVTVIYVAP